MSDADPQIFGLIILTAYFVGMGIGLFLGRVFWRKQ
jgi:hypothetical protein